MSYAGETPSYTSVTAGNVTIVGDYVYFGDISTDGSWRIAKDGANLNIEVRVSGVWTEKDVITP